MSSSPLRPLQNSRAPAPLYDLVVLGAGFSGLGAALTAAAKGWRVAIVCPQADLGWEATRCGVTALGTNSGDPNWGALVDLGRTHGAIVRNDCDDAAIEIVLAAFLSKSPIDLLFYAVPGAWSHAETGILQLPLAAKNGTIHLRTRRLLDTRPSHDPIQRPARVAWFFKLQNAFSDGTTRSGTCESQIEYQLDATLRASELAVRWTSASDLALHDAIPAILHALENSTGLNLSGAAMSFAHLVPYPLPGSPRLSAAPIASLAPYRAIPLPPLTTPLAERFSLGVDAVANWEAVSDGSYDQVEQVMPHQELRADVVICGGGTAGTIAALAAARQGADVILLEASHRIGGVATGAGINSYYHGVKGGIQDEVDARTNELMRTLPFLKSGPGSHPIARRLAIERMLLESQVRVMINAAPVQVELKGERITALTAWSPQARLQITAKGFVDATGDGDLCALAGASILPLGRAGDQVIHAYSLPIQVGIKKAGEFALRTSYFDAGYVNASDSWELTRARLSALLQWLYPRFTEEERPVAIFPQLGVRQSRQIKTDYALTMADVIEHREFDDSIGGVACHFDNHHVDYEFESDELLFWVWVCWQWRLHVGCDLPYRCLLPQGFQNIWIGCRALGVTQDAHYAIRMRRDMSRAGEAAGCAAAICARTGADARSIVNPLRQALAATGAIASRTSGEAGKHVDALVQEAIAAIREHRPDVSLWWLYRFGKTEQPRVISLINDPDPRVSWLAASVTAMWRDPSAEPRLLTAILNKEYGFDHVVDAPVHKHESILIETTRPEGNMRRVPNWLAAISLLRRCGTARSLPVLEKITRSNPPFNVRTAIALTLEQLVAHGSCNDTDRKKIGLLCDQLMISLPAKTSFIPQRNLTLEIAGVSAVDTVSRTALTKSAIQRSEQDFLWQLFTVTHRLNQSLGRVTKLPVSPTGSVLAHVQPDTRLPIPNSPP